MATVPDVLAAALEHHRAKRVHEAEQLYRQILAIDPNNVDALHLIGVVAYEAGKQDAAIEYIRRALDLNPDFSEAHYNLGNAWLKKGENDNAIACYRRSLELRLNFSTLHYNLGLALYRKGNKEDAAVSYRRAIDLQPEYAEAYTDLGCALKDEGKLDEAVASFRRAVELKPDFAEAHSNLGSGLHKQGNLDEAITCYCQAVELKPTLAEAHCNLGLALQDRGELKAAGTSYSRALQLQPDLAEAHFCQSSLMLLRGDFENGWSEYEWRWKKGAKREFCAARWDGSPLHGRRILIHSEQGFGDTIQFIRYAAMLKQHEATIIFECQKPLVSLLATYRGIDRLIAEGGELPAFDFHAPLLSLPGIIKTTLKTIPADVPYLFADPSLVAEWREKLSGIRGLRVGINWQGRSGIGPWQKRNIPVELLASLAEIPSVRLISLRKDGDEEELPAMRDRVPIVDLGEFDTGHGAFMDTAAIMMNLDLVITSDTSIPHLAGALGVPVWVALPFVPDWRWLLNRSDSPWYPTMRLFRQTRSGDWTVVLEELQTALRGLVNP